MRLSIDDILVAHGIGGGPGPYFGNGSDGAFNPALNTVSGTANLNITDYYATTSSSNPSIAGGIVFAIGLVTAPNSSNIQSTYSGSFTTGTAGYTYGVTFTINVALAISGVQIYTGNAPGSNIYLNQGATNLVTQSVPAANMTSGGWTTITFASPVTLQANTTYTLSIYSSSQLILGNGTQNQSVAFNNVPQPTTITFTAPALDGGPVIKQFTSVNIPAGLTATVDKRCQGLIMLVNGNVTINGTLSMDYIGPLIDPTTIQGYAIPDKVTQLYYPLGNNKVIPIGVGGAGGAGGVGGIVAAYNTTSNPYCVASSIAVGSNGLSGTWFGGGRGGGGGGGGSGTRYNSVIVSNGGSSGGTVGYTGTPTGGGGGSVSGTGSQVLVSANGSSGSNGGGGGGAATLCQENYNCTATGGSGGSPTGAGGGGGGGGASCDNINSSATITGGSGGSPTGGAGGLILIIASGNITINSGAILTAKGSNGGNGGMGVSGGNSGANASGGGGGGGGAGGGIIALFYRGTYSNSGTLSVTGGSGGVGGGGTRYNDTNNLYVAFSGGNGKNGQNGTIQTVQL